MPLLSPIFRKLLLSALALVGVTVFVLDFYLTRYVEHREIAGIREQLTTEAQILARVTRAIARPQFEDWAKAEEVRAQARITVIDARGAVVADSRHDPESMENHAQRPEIREAYRGRPGFSIRHSATLERDFCYLAVPLDDPARPGWVLRLAVPLHGVSAAIATIRWHVAGASLIAAIIALAMAFYFSRRFTARIRRLQTFAEGLLETGSPAKLPPDARDELGALAVSLSGAAVQLRDLIARLSLEANQREAILSSMVEGVLAVDDELRVVFCNDAFARAVGAEAPVAPRLPVAELVRDPQLLEMLSRVLFDGVPLKQRIELKAARNRAFEVQGTPLAGPDHRGALALLHDITDIERLERVRKDFVANVSHELRTPLTAIRGYAETLLDGALEDEEHNRKFLETIRAHAIRLNNIASDLLVLSELESDQTPAEPEPVSMRAAVESALRTVESEARIRSVRLECGRLEDVEVMGSRIRVEQALVNLLDNAVKFNRPGGEVRISLACNADGKAEITVADTGIGIPSQDLPRIFERFYRVDKARSRAVGGTGLGLSIVKHVVERMNGTITVESELGKGSVFRVWLPAIQRQPAD